MRASTEPSVRPGSRWARLALSAVILVASWPAHAWAEPRGAGDPADAPHPPPATVGEPLPGSEAATPPPSPPRPPARRDDDEESEAARRYVLEGVDVRGNTATLSRTVLRYVPFERGEYLDPTDERLTRVRYRLLGTGYFRDVALSLRRGSRRGTVVLVVTVVERNTIILDDAWLGLSADADGSGNARPLTAFGGASAAETNLAGTGVTLGGAAVVAEGQLALRARFVDPAFLRSGWTLETELLYDRARDYFGTKDVVVSERGGPTDYALAEYKRFGGMLGGGHDLDVSTQFYLGYRLERITADLPAAAAERRGNESVPIDFSLSAGPSVLSTARATLVHDTRDDPFLPTRGVRAVAVGELSLTPLGSDYPYAKVELRGEHDIALRGGHVLELSAFGGAIAGDAPLFERYYAADLSDFLPDRVLDLNVDRRTSPNFLGTSIASRLRGTYAAKVSGSYRVPLYRGTRSVYGVDVFASAGLFALANNDDLLNPSITYRGFSRLPIDVTVNLGLKVETSAGGFTFGLGNVLGFFPVRAEAR